jgi:uncharacterized protein (TIGR02265 family)
MPEERYVFPASAEGILLGLGERATPAFKAHMKKAGLDFDKLPPAFPFDVYTPYLRIAAVFAWPEVPEEEAMRLLGLHFVRGWQSTVMGSAMSVMLRLLGPQRTLTRLDRAFRTSNNFTRATTQLVGTNEALVTINEIQGSPEYYIGILQGGLEVIGKTGTVTLQDVSLPSGTFRMTWL